MIDLSNVDLLLSYAERNDEKSLKYLESELRRQRRNAKAQISKRNKEIEKASGTLKGIIDSEKQIYIKQVVQYDKLIEATQQARKTGKKISKSAFYTISAEKTASSKIGKGFAKLSKARESKLEDYADHILFDYVLKRELFNLDEQGLEKVQRELKKIGYDYISRLKEEFKKLPKDWTSDEVADVVELVNAEAIEHINNSDKQNQKLIDIANYLEYV